MYCKRPISIASVEPRCYELLWFNAGFRNVALFGGNDWWRIELPTDRLGLLHCTHTVGNSPNDLQVVVLPSITNQECKEIGLKPSETEMCCAHAHILISDTVLLGWVSIEGGKEISTEIQYISDFKVISSESAEIAYCLVWCLGGGRKKIYIASFLKLFLQSLGRNYV